MPLTNIVSNREYVGRFAPSPSGPLHFGSLIAALASYLQAKSQDGKWLLRIEDIDPPREVAGATEQIPESLQAHGLLWDADVSKQSEHSHRYKANLAKLNQLGLSYLCDCTRKQIKANGQFYNGHCRARQLQDTNTCALRFINQTPTASFQDGLLGQVNCDQQLATEDFVLKRRDGLYAYHLAVVSDDIAQGITEIVRGADLVETTSCHLALYHALGATPPSYIHVPVACSLPGKKLSKQNHAPPLKDEMAVTNLYHALLFLNQQPHESLQNSKVEEVLNWAISHWQLAKVPKKREIVTSFY